MIKAIKHAITADDFLDLLIVVIWTWVKVFY